LVWYAVSDVSAGLGNEVAGVMSEYHLILLLIGEVFSEHCIFAQQFRPFYLHHLVSEES
jgi:hypothetical protein